MVRFFERLVGKIEEKLQRRDQRGLFHLLKSTQVEEVRIDEQGELLRDADLICERWVRHFGSLLNAKSETLDFTVISKIPQRPVAEALGEEPTEDEAAAALRSMPTAFAFSSAAKQRQLHPPLALPQVPPRRAAEGFWR